MRCWSQGCTPAQIVAALGLSLKDLFDDHGATPAQRQQVEQERQARDSEQRKAKAADRKLIAQLWQLREWIQQAGAALARNPAHATLGKELHDAFERYAKLEAQLYPTPEDGPQPQQPAQETPPWIDRELKAVFPKPASSAAQYVA